MYVLHKCVVIHTHILAYTFGKHVYRKTNLSVYFGKKMAGWTNARNRYGAKGNDSS
jgi:hypothetical protein